jgi:hypothetical protein
LDKTQYPRAFEAQGRKSYRKPKLMKASSTQIDRDQAVIDNTPPSNGSSCKIYFEAHLS